LLAGTGEEADHITRSEKEKLMIVQREKARNAGWLRVVSIPTFCGSYATSMMLAHTELA
jgi:hypothetical protein